MSSEFIYCVYVNAEGFCTTEIHSFFRVFLHYVNAKLLSDTLVTNDSVKTTKHPLMMLVVNFYGYHTVPVYAILLWVASGFQKHASRWTGGTKLSGEALNSVQH